ncbi:MAG TPA: hypothetical protein HA254_02395 [Candidatus Diapherotrites archaeon]|uniref:Uncharacterized protein n=1 Tax=Candidatus Iainarchaeum sp. TaxID=3101447 RepID=A0A7J4J0A2_9ARCH|nr:hypothetical protein [Candidatus Diapherotrites archaeon]
MKMNEKGFLKMPFFGARRRQQPAHASSPAQGQSTDHAQPRQIEPSARYGFSQGGVEVRGRLVRERREHIGREQELAQVQQMLRFRPMDNEAVHRLPVHLREEHTTKMLFLDSLARGEVRDFRDFELWLTNYLTQAKMNGAPINNPQLAAKEAVRKLARPFNPEQRKKLQLYFDNLGMIGRGGDPHD